MFKFSRTPYPVKLCLCFVPFLSIDDLIDIFNPSGIDIIHKEVLKGTEVILSCMVTGLTQNLDTFKWYDSHGFLLDNSLTDYGIDLSPLDDEFNNQTMELTVPSFRNTEDTFYTCKVSSAEHGNDTFEANVSLCVYSTFHFNSRRFCRITNYTGLVHIPGERRIRYRR